MMTAPADIRGHAPGVVQDTKNLSPATETTRKNLADTIFTVKNTTPDIVHLLAENQRACFPTLAEDGIITASHYLSHLQFFPEGQFTLLTEEGMPVASSSDFRVDFDLNHYQHTYTGISDNLTFSTHKPDGQWLYGADIGVHPAYRGIGLSRLLYNARHDLIRRLNLKGHIACGVMAGYGKHKNQMDAETYLERVVAGEIFDPTVSVQLKRGFKVYGVIHDFVTDESCDGKAAFLVWHNPDYKE